METTLNDVGLITLTWFPNDSKKRKKRLDFRVVALLFSALVHPCVTDPVGPPPTGKIGRKFVSGEKNTLKFRLIGKIH